MEEIEPTFPSESDYKELLLFMTFIEKVHINIS